MDMLRTAANKLLQAMSPNRDDTLFGAQDAYKRYALEMSEAGQQPLPFREWLQSRQAPMPQGPARNNALLNPPLR